MQRIVVVLPAPFGPRKPVTLPGSMPNVKSSTATLSPYRFVSPRTSIMETGPLQEPFEKSSQQGKKVASRPSSSCPPADCRRVARGDDYAILLQDEPLSADTGGRGRSTGRGRGWQCPGTVTGMVALLLVAASLGLSNFAASVGIGVSGVDGRTRLRVGLVFGAFETAMPVIGLLLGRGLASALGQAAHWIGAGLLIATGLYAVV